MLHIKEAHMYYRTLTSSCKWAIILSRGVIWSDLYFGKSLGGFLKDRFEGDNLELRGQVRDIVSII